MSTDRNSSPGLLRASALVALALTVVAHADDVRLRASVRLPADADAIRLVHIADLEGDEAERLGEMLIDTLPDSSAPIEIRIRNVRAKLDEAGVHWGRVNLSGRQVIVRPAPRRAAAVPTAMTGATLEPSTPGGPRRVDDDTIELLAHRVDDASVLRGVVARMFVEALEVAPDALRLTLDRAACEELESRPAGARFEITPQGSLRSDRVKLAVRVWRGGRVEAAGMLATQPLVRTQCPVPRREIERGASIDADDLEIEVRWLPPSRADLICEPDAAAGRISARRLDAGDALRKQHVRRRSVVERGDRVNVRCLVGGIVITLQAEARADAAVGESIEMRKLGERSSFVASVTGPGEAVIDLAR